MTKDLIEQLPDFDDMDKMAKISTSSKAKLEDAKNRLEMFVAFCIREAMLNKEYWINSKPPAMSYAQSVIAIYGNTDEQAKHLEDLRNEVVQFEQAYKEAAMLLNNMRDRISVWQTYSANTRKANI